MLGPGRGFPSGGGSGRVPETVRGCLRAPLGGERELHLQVLGQELRLGDSFSFSVIH